MRSQRQVLLFGSGRRGRPPAVSFFNSSSTKRIAASILALLFSNAGTVFTGAAAEAHAHFPRPAARRTRSPRPQTAAKRVSSFALRRAAAPAQLVLKNPASLDHHDHDNPIPPAMNQTRASPYVTQEECEEFAKSVYRKPAVTCERVEVDEDTDACKCKVPLPASVHPVPDTMESVIDAPAAAPPGAAGGIAAPGSPGTSPAPQFEPLPPPPRAINSLAPYSPPHMLATCPYHRACLEETKCVGYNNWGFTKVVQSKYSAASRLLNTIYCMYYMSIETPFEVPLRVKRSKEREEQEGKAA